MSALATVSAVAVTLGGIGRLAATDPKRRRSFGLAPYHGSRQVALAVTAVFLPGVLLLALGTGADFVAWLGAVCVAGWGVAAMSPLRIADAVRRGDRIRARSKRLAASAAATLRDLVHDVRRRSARPSLRAAPAADFLDEARIAELERRVAQLEAMLASGARATGPWEANVVVAAPEEAGDGGAGLPRRDAGEEARHRRCSAA